MQSEVLSSIFIAAHELKSPLALTRQLALALPLAQTSSDRMALSRQIVSVSERALRQVSDLTKVARLEDSLFTLEPVSVRSVCDQVSNELSRLYSSEQRTLATTYSNKSRLAIANSELLFSVIYNFCLNALHYSTPQTTSQLAVRDHQGAIRIAVRDYGPALPTAIWRELRSGLVNRPTAIAMRPGSSGLGLYIVSKFSQYMRGHVGAIRHRDGTSFFIDLPISNQMSFFS